MSKNIPKINRTLIPLGCKRKRGLCFPKESLHSVYFAKKKPVSPDIVLDEYTKFNTVDANLVQSNCLYFDGSCYVKTESGYVHDGITLEVKMLFKTGNLTGGIENLINKYKTIANREFVVYINGNDLVIEIYDNNDDMVVLTDSNVIQSNTFYDWSFVFDGNTNLLTTKTNGVYNVHDTRKNSLKNTSNTIRIGEFPPNPGTFVGEIYYVKIGDAEYNLAEGNGINLYNTGTACGTAEIFSSIDNFWFKKQDVYHYNIINGFDLWKNTAGLILRAPIGSNVLEPGYTKISSNPAGKWHNNAETGIQLDSSLQSIQDIVPITSLTKNASLKFDDNGNIKESSSTTNVFEVYDGARFFANSPDTSSVEFNGINIESGKTYMYYINIVGVTGNLSLEIGNSTVNSLSDGEYSGNISPTASGHIKLTNNTSTIDLTVKQLAIWEENTIPPLFYNDFEFDFNNSHQVFSDVTENKKKSLIIYDYEILDDKILGKIYNCTKNNVWIDSNFWIDSNTWYD